MDFELCFQDKEEIPMLEFSQQSSEYGNESHQ